MVRVSILSMLLAATVLSAGCKAPWSGGFSKMFSLDSSWPWDDDGPQEGTPVRLVGNWVDAVLNQAGQPSQRGFGGRIVFYGKDSDEPILVDGQLVVYAFDESNREPTDNRPTRRYVFPPDEVARRMSVSDVGPSYSFWLPWDEVGGPQTEVSLIARFEPKGGAVVVGEQTRHLLPGALRPTEVATSKSPPKLPEGVPSRPAMPQLASCASGMPAPDPQVRQAGYENPTLADRPRRMTTTSISLPDHFGRRIGQSAASSVPTLPSPTSVHNTAADGAAPVATARPIRQAPLSAAQQLPPIGAGLPPMPQSPFAGRAIYGAPQMPAGLPQPLGPQVPTTATEGQWQTTVSYSPAAGAAGWAATTPPPSTGSQPPQLPAPATPIAR